MSRQQQPEPEHARDDIVTSLSQAAGRANSPVQEKATTSNVVAIRVTNGMGAHSLLTGR